MCPRVCSHLGSIGGEAAGSDPSVAVSLADSLDLRAIGAIPHHHDRILPNLRLGSRGVTQIVLRWDGHTVRSHLARCNCPAIRMHGHAKDVIVVAQEMPLRMSLLRYEVESLTENQRLGVGKEKKELLLTLLYTTPTAAAK